MKIIVSLFFIVISIFGTIFIHSYTGTMLPHLTLWFLLFLFLGIIGLLLLVSSFREADKTIEQIQHAKKEQIRKNAEKIELDFEYCEFNNGSYYHEINDDNVNTINIIAPGNFSYDATKIKMVNQSSLIYHLPATSSKEKYIGSFPFDSISLKAYVLQKQIHLYIDRVDRSKYFFELEP